MPTLIARIMKMRGLSQQCSKAYVQSVLGLQSERAREILLASTRLLYENFDDLLKQYPPDEVLHALLALERQIAQLTTLALATPTQQGVLPVVEVADALLMAASDAVRAYETLAGAPMPRLMQVACSQRAVSQRFARAAFVRAAGRETALTHEQLMDTRATFPLGLQTMAGAGTTSALIGFELGQARSLWDACEVALEAAPREQALYMLADNSEQVLGVMDNLTSLYQRAARPA